MLQPYAKIISINVFHHQSIQHNDKVKTEMYTFLQMINNVKYYIDISILTLYYDTWNLAQIPPISLDHL